MLVLGIDTSGKTASCALCTEEAVIAQNTFITEHTHSQVIMPMVKKMLADAGTCLNNVDGIAVISGPGSYTGLRIGIAAAKGICFALDKPCAGVSALESLAYNFRGIAGAAVVPVMHARQELVYTAGFRISPEGVLREHEDRIISGEQTLREISGKSAYVYFTGDYAEKLYSMRENVYGEGKENNQLLAPPHLRAPLASSLCYAAMEHGFGSAEELNAEYMQITKAEKDLLERGTPLGSPPSGSEGKI